MELLNTLLMTTGVVVRTDTRNLYVMEHCFGDIHLSNVKQSGQTPGIFM
ncbi:Uncharacterized protein dnm_064710 [Desulfonema magnum]|uniref:Uncharacterized protein n=1 Tax=Desulfonema magnum TaxID=45655 RepID=A0A975BRT5_9BACT|nr:Uncharacterized protein dnm_064710 [Desulfonema magnum]